MDKMKVGYDKQIFLEIKVHLARDIEQFVLLCDIALFLLKSLRLFFWNTLNGNSQSDHQLIRLADIRRSYLIYFQVRNMLKILPNKIS